MNPKSIQLTPAQLEKLGVDHESIVGPDILKSFTFGWKPESEGGNMFCNAQFKQPLRGELAELRAVQLIQAFESAIAISGLLAEVGRTELFPSNAGASVIINGREIRLPDDWQE